MPREEGGGQRKKMKLEIDPTDFKQPKLEIPDKESSDFDRSQNRENSGEVKPTTSTNADVPMSKRERKRLKKKQLLEETKPLRRQQEKDRRKARMKSRRERGEPIPMSRKMVKNMEHKQAGWSLAIDMSFDDLMIEKDRKKLICQLQFSYSSIRRSPVRPELHICSMSGNTLAMFEGWQGVKNWAVNRHDADRYSDLWDKEKIVYLTAESDRVVDRLEDGKVYVIGGLVDHNSQKGLCQRLATEAGIQTGRLPIEEYLKMSSRKVLTVNQVVDILLQFEMLGDWKEALLKVIPKRKGAEGKA